MKQQYVVPHKIRQNEIPAFLDTCVINTPSTKKQCQQKNHNLFSIFVKK